MPSVENLRKQAKRIVRWHRTGHHPVAELIRTHLSAYSDMPDSEILAGRFQLADAQELVARQHGYPDWNSLLAGTSIMPESQPAASPTPEFVRAEAQLLVADLAASLEFFTSKLGFERRFEYGDPPFYAQIVRGGAHLNLRSADAPLLDPQSARSEEYLAATVCVTGIKELYLEWKGAGVEFHQALRTEPWGARSFIVLDPDGNLILFAE